jgi:sporulation protein YlmC with PRC-barrel domain
MNIEKLKGMSVVSVSEGSRLGRIADILIEPREMQIGAVKIEHENQSFVIPFNLIKSIGSDAITVESSQVTQADGGSFGTLVGIGDFKKLKVVDETGTLHGTISGVEMDAATGKIGSFTAHKGGMLGLGGTTTSVTSEQVRGIGPEVVTVAVAAADDAPQA